MILQKSIITIGAIVFLSYLINLKLHVDADKPNETKNGFERLHKPDYLKGGKTYDLQDNAFRIAGVAQNSIYLSTLIPGTFRVLDVKTGKAEIRKMRNLVVPAVNEYNDTKIDSPFIHISIGNPRITYFGNIDDLLVRDSVRSSYLFMRSCIISDNSMIYCGFDTGSQPRQIFAKYNLGENSHLRDTLFSSDKRDPIANDGLLVYDKVTGTVFYTHFYRKEILMMDTLLRYKGMMNTIGITHNKQTEGALGEAKNKSALYTNSTPKYGVLSSTYISDGKLYIISDMKADNETIGDFNSKAVFDVYDTRTGTYELSFNVPQSSDDKVRDFTVVDHKLYLLFKRKLLVFDLRR